MKERTSFVIEPSDRNFIDNLVKERVFSSMGHFIQYAVSKLIKELKKESKNDKS